MSNTELQNQIDEMKKEIQKLKAQTIHKIVINDELSGYDSDILESKTSKGKIITISITERC